MLWRVDEPLATARHLCFGPLLSLFYGVPAEVFRLIPRRFIEPETIHGLILPSFPSEEEFTEKGDCYCVIVGAFAASWCGVCPFE